MFSMKSYYLCVDRGLGWKCMEFRSFEEADTYCKKYHGVNENKTRLVETLNYPYTYMKEVALWNKLSRPILVKPGFRKNY